MSLLPEDYADLEQYVARWGCDTQDERQNARRTSSPSELQALYDALKPALPGILEALDQYPLGELPEDHRALFNLACSFAEVAPHVELYHCSPDVPNSFEESRMRARHGSQPTWKARG